MPVLNKKKFNVGDRMYDKLFKDKATLTATINRMMVSSKRDEELYKAVISLYIANEVIDSFLTGKIEMETYNDVIDYASETFDNEMALLVKDMLISRVYV